MEQELRKLNQKLFHIQMLLEECITDLEGLNKELDKSLNKPKGITNSRQFVFGD